MDLFTYQTRHPDVPDRVVSAIKVYRTETGAHLAASAFLCKNGDFGFEVRVVELMVEGTGRVAVPLDNRPWFKLES